MEKDIALMELISISTAPPDDPEIRAGRRNLSQRLVTMTIEDETPWLLPDDSTTASKVDPIIGKRPEDMTSDELAKWYAIKMEMKNKTFGAKESADG